MGLIGCKIGCLCDFYVTLALPGPFCDTNVTVSRVLPCPLVMDNRTRAETQEKPRGLVLLGWVWYTDYGSVVTVRKSQQAVNLSFRPCNSDPSLQCDKPAWHNLNTQPTADKNTPESLKTLRWEIYDLLDRYNADYGRTIKFTLMQEVERLFNLYTNS